MNEAKFHKIKSWSRILC